MDKIIQAVLSKDIKMLIEVIGVWGVYLIVFAESGLLIGFFLPGDSLLFTAGFLSSPSQHFFDVWALVLGAWVAAVLGDNVGYEFGKRVGRQLFQKEKSFLFNPENLIKAQNFYEKHGGKAITYARFIPVVRTFVPIVAGIGNMDHKTFTVYNFLGGTAWVWSIVFAGYFLGNIPGVEKFITPIILAIIVISLIPPVMHVYRDNREVINAKVKSFLRK